MGGLPTLLVELDDGTGTFPHDITTYVDLSAEWSITRGRDSEGDSIDPSTLTISLKNDLAHFTLGSPTFGIAIDQMIRVTETLGATTSARFTGYVQNWPTSWDSPIGTKSTTTINAVDRLARLERRQLRSMLEQEFVFDEPVAYYTLGEPEGSTSAGDTSGNAAAPLTLNGTGDPPVFGNGIGPGVDDLTAVQFMGGQYLSSTAGAGLAPPFTFECFILRSGAPVLVFGESVLTISRPTQRCRAFVATTSGEFYLAMTGLTGTPLSSGVNVCDGSTHHVAVTVSATDVEIYVDGVMEATAAVSPTSETLNRFSAGGDPGDLLTAPLTGTVSHVCLTPGVLSASRIAAHALAGLEGFGGDTSDERVERLASYANVDLADMALDAGIATLTEQTTAGRSVMDALNEVAATEGGTLFIAGDGDLTFQNRTHRTYAATSTAAVALTTEDADHADLTWSGDKNYLVNYVEGSRPNGATQVVRDAASIGRHEQYPSSVSLLVESDDEVRDAASWHVSTYGTVTPRITSVTIDLMTLADDALREALLALALGDRVTISGFPSQSPKATADLIVEGSNESQSIGTWKLALNTVPAEIFCAWVLEDPVYGALEAPFTRLHY